ncbi:hypothetical protein ACHAXA_009858 [Cyclostephanos tholiformis]|uniref:Uncharacterized protein n=1 Tax=Cyclostephanos tholiformis TaxID=382380 RepID=A0ABD3R8V7_9STRA
MTPTIPSHFTVLDDLGDQTRLNVTLKPRKQWRLSPRKQVAQDSLESSVTNEPVLQHLLAECNSSNAIFSTSEMTGYADEHIPPYPFFPMSMASGELRADQTDNVNNRIKPFIDLDLQHEQESSVLLWNDVVMRSTPSKFRLPNDHEACPTLTSEVLNRGFNPIHPARNEGFSPALVIRPLPIRYKQVRLQDSFHN